MNGEGLTQALRYGALAFAVVAVCTSVGLVVAIPFGRRTGDRALSATVGGLSLAVIAATWWAYTERPIGAVVVGLLAAAAVGAGVGAFWMARGQRSGAARTASVRAAVAALLTIVAAVAFAVLQYWPVLSSGFLPDDTIAFTNSNNDIAYYVMQSDNVAHAGYGELGRLAALAVGSWTKGDHAGTAATLATFSDLLARPTWRGTIPVMVAIIAVTILCLAAIARRAGRVGRVAAIAAGLWAVSAPFPSAVQSDYFLGQSLSRAILFAQVLFVLQVFEWEGPPLRGLLPVGLLAVTTSAGLLAYPTGQFTNAVVLGAIAVCLFASLWFRRRARTARKQAGIRFGLVAGSFVVGVLLIAPRWQITLDTIRFYSKPGITGFPLPTLDFVMLAGIGRSPSRWSPFGPWLAALVLGLAAVGVVACARRLRSVLWPLGALVLVPVVGYVALIVRFGSTAYQTWKYVASAQPLVLVAVGVLAIHGAVALVDLAARHIGRARALRVLAIVPVAAIALFAFSTSQQTWREATISRDTFAALHVAPALTRVGDDAYVRAQPNLVVALAPYFETMMTASVGDLSGVVYGAPTYLGPAERGAGCALVHDASVPEGAPPYHRVGPDLLLGPIDQCAPPSRAP